ncbi:MAG: hypothetical protein PUB22_02155, partial [Clostridiales bacterium]|nr:hypothetical protein [Clostridiales bacterium]
IASSITIISTEERIFWRIFILILLLKIDELRVSDLPVPYSPLIAWDRKSIYANRRLLPSGAYRIQKIMYLPFRNKTISPEPENT